MYYSPSIAKPYAQALFELAKEQGLQQLFLWSNILSYKAYIVTNPLIKQFLDNPRIRNQMMAQLFIDILTQCIDVTDKIIIEIKRLLIMLIRYHRLHYLPQISHQYDILWNEYRKIRLLRIKSAKELTSQQQQQLSQALKKRFKREIQLVIEIDSTLLGGMMIYINDTVIDRSIRGQLKRLNSMLKEGHHE